MSGHLQRFVDNFLKGAALGSTVVDRWEKAADRRDAREIAREKNRIAAQQHADKMADQRLRTQGYLQDVAGRYAYNMRRGAGGGGAGGPSPGAQQFVKELGDAGIDVAPPPERPQINVNVPDAGDGGATPQPPGDGGDGTVPELARGGRVGSNMGQAIQMGANAFAKYRTRRDYPPTGTPPINPTPDMGGTTGPGSGYGQTAAPPASYQPGAIQTSYLPDLSQSGQEFRRGGRVRRFAQGGPVDTLTDMIQRNTAMADAGARQRGGPGGGGSANAATGSGGDAAGGASGTGGIGGSATGGAGGSAAAGTSGEAGSDGSGTYRRGGKVQRFADGGEVQIGPDGYPIPTEPLWSPSGDWAREGTLERIRQARLARNTTGQPGSEDQTPPALPAEARRRGEYGEPNREGSQYRGDDREDAYRWAEQTPSRIARTDRRPASVEGSPVIRPPQSTFVGEEARADERRPQQSTFVGEEARADETKFDQPPAPPGAKPSARTGGGNGTAVRTGVPQRLQLGDQRRTAAYDPEADRMDPRNTAVVEPGGAVNERVYRGLQGAGRGDNVGAFGERLDRPGAQPVPARPEDYATGAVEYAGRVVGQGGQQGQAELYHGKGTPDPQTMDQVMKVVDPEGKMPIDQRMQAAAKATHDWYMAQGDAEGAKRAAFEVTQYGVTQSRNHGVAAAKAAQAGDLQGAVNQLIEGYQWLPNGKRAVVQGGQLVIVDADGKGTMTIPLNPQTVNNLAMGMATGKLGWDVMQHSAGVPPPQVAGVQTGPRPAAPAAPSRPAAQPSAAPAGPAQPPAAPPSAAAAAAPAATNAAPSAPAAPAAGAPSRPAPPQTTVAQGSQDGGTGQGTAEDFYRKNPRGVYQAPQVDELGALQRARVAEEKEFHVERQKIMLRATQLLGKGDKGYLTAALAAHKARFDKRIAELQHREDQLVQFQRQDQQTSRQERKPRDVTISDARELQQPFNDTVAKVAADKNLIKNTVLENLKTEQDRKPLHDIASRLWTQNRNLSPEQAMNYALGVTSIKPDGEGFNYGKGKDALQFRASTGPNGPVIELENGDKLKIDQATYRAINDLQRKNWQARDEALAKQKKDEEEKKKRGGIMPKVQAVTEALRIVPPGGGPLPIRLPKMF